MIGDGDTDRCACGAEKQRRNMACDDCWQLAPRALRDALIAEPEKTKRIEIAMQIREAIDGARNGSQARGVCFADQPRLFVELMLAKVAAKNADEAPVETMGDAFDELGEALLMLDHCDDPRAQLENLTDLAAIALRAAHSVAMPNLGEEQLRDIAAEWTEEDAR